MRQLPPLLLRDKYWRNIEAEIIRIWADLIFRPLLCDLKKPEREIQNTASALLDAISQGTVWWQDGVFKGKYNSRISMALKALGATYNEPSKTWSLPRELIPVDIRFAQAHADARYNDLRHSMLRTMDEMNIESINQISSIPDAYTDTIDWMEGDFQKTLRAVTIEAKLTPSQRGTIAAEWGQNLDKYVKDFAAEKILEMRELVSTNAFAGRRSADLLDMLKDNYGVSQRKARFLARQETSLLLSKFREVRYRDIGAERYRWSTSHDERVRHDHHDLNDKIFRWDMPPVTNRKTGARNNPGEDFGCRCVAIAMFD